MHPQQKEKDIFDTMDRLSDSFHSHPELGVFCSCALVAIGAFGLLYYVPKLP